MHVVEVRRVIVAEEEAEVAVAVLAARLEQVRFQREVTELEVPDERDALG